MYNYESMLAIITENWVDKKAFISDNIEWEYVEAEISRPRSMELSNRELVEELSRYVWWLSLEELFFKFNV